MIKCLRMFDVLSSKIAVFAGIAFLTVASAASAQTAATTDAAGTFKAKCVTCHAADGSGSALGKRLHAPDLNSKEVQEKTNAALALVIASGKNNMPAFKNRLDDQQIEKLVEYVRTFHADAAAPK